MPPFYVGFNWLKTTEPIRGNIFLPLSAQEIPVLIWMTLEGLKDEPWSHVVILNPAPGDWEFRALTKPIGKAYKVVLLRELLRHSIFKNV